MEEEIRNERRFPVITVIISAILTVIFGLMGVTYSNVNRRIDEKANKESVVLIEQKIEAQLDMQNGYLNDVKSSLNRLELMHLKGQVK